MAFLKPLMNVKRDKDSNTIIMGATIPQKKQQLIYSMIVTNIHKAFHSTFAEYTFFSAMHGPYPRIDHTLGYKAILHKLKRIRKMEEKKK